MYQEAIEQSARESGIFELAQFSLTCPRTEFGALQPNAEMERIDAALSASYSAPEECSMISQESDSNIDDMNAMTFMSAKELEEIFEYFWWNNNLETSSSFRSYHHGRIYGSGQYGDGRKEAMFQDFIRNADLVYETLEKISARVPEPRSELYAFDALQDDAYEMLAEPMDQSVDDSAEALEEEPFIRGEVVSREAEEIMEREFYIDYWDRQMPQNDEEDYDEVQRRLEERWEEEMEYEERWADF
jgi:hypothetical protein